MRSRTSNHTSRTDGHPDHGEIDEDMKRRGWVSLAERLRCTYLTREELPRAEAARAEVVRLSATPA